jgi:hypothetical protein
VTLILITILLAGCASAEKSWQEVKTKDYANAYKNFIREYPDSVYVAEALEKIDHIDFERASNKGRISDYQAYLKEHPKGLHASTAEDKIAAIRHEKIRIDFEAAKKNSSIKSYRSFLKKHQDSPFKEKALAAISEFNRQRRRLCSSVQWNKEVSWISKSTAVHIRKGTTLPRHKKNSMNFPGKNSSMKNLSPGSNWADMASWIRPDLSKKCTLEILVCHSSHSPKDRTFPG